MLPYPIDGNRFFHNDELNVTIVPFIDLNSTIYFKVWQSFGSYVSIQLFVYSIKDWNDARDKPRLQEYLDRIGDQIQKKYEDRKFRLMAWNLTKQSEIWAQMMEAGFNNMTKAAIEATSSMKAFGASVARIKDRLNGVNNHVPPTQRTRRRRS